MQDLWYNSFWAQMLKSSVYAGTIREEGLLYVRTARKV